MTIDNLALPLSPISHPSSRSFEKSFATKAIVPVELIERRIYLIRGLKAMLDSELAGLYQVKPIGLRQQVKLNIDRFPYRHMPARAEEILNGFFVISVRDTIRSGEEVIHVSNIRS